jgi:hypothetical protein
MIEDKSFVLKSMGGIDETTFDVSICQPFS